MLRSCPDCHRHVRDEEACPFCGSDDARRAVVAGPVARRVSAAALLFVGAIGVSACYGGAPVDYDPPEDETTSGADERGSQQSGEQGDEHEGESEDEGE